MSDLATVLTKESITYRSTSAWAVKCQQGGIRFELELAKLDEVDSAYVLGFKRIAGDLANYKILCSQLLADLKL